MASIACRCILRCNCSDGFTYEQAYYRESWDWDKINLAKILAGRKRRRTAKMEEYQLEHCAKALTEAKPSDSKMQSGTPFKRHSIAAGSLCADRLASKTFGLLQPPLLRRHAFEARDWLHDDLLILEY